MEDYIVGWVFWGVLAWGAAFAAARVLLPGRSFDFCNRLVSTAHACLAVALVTMTVRDWRCPVCPLASASSPEQMRTLAISLSYMIYDLVCCHMDKQKPVGVDNSVHHLVSIVGIGAGLAYQRCGSEMVASLWITEISSPFLHLRELLKEVGHKGTDLNLAADVLFGITFSLARMGLGPCLVYVTLTADNPFIIKAMASGLQLVSAFWFYKIVRMLKYKLAKRVAPSKKTA